MNCLTVRLPTWRWLCCSLRLTGPRTGRLPWWASPPSQSPSACRRSSTSIAGTPSAMSRRRKTMANDGGIGRLNRRLAAIPGQVREAAQKAVVRQANTMAKAMKAKVPIDTGKLRDSIVVTHPDARTPPYSQPGGSVIVPEMTAAITAGNKDVRYAHLVEYGTAK